MIDLKSADWQPLVEAAKVAYDRAYAPYSQFHVGSAAMTKDGAVVSGCNVENASYGLTVCAERNCLAQGVIQGETVFQRIVVFTKEEKLTPPCGACRQVIAEFLPQDAQVVSVNHLDKFKVWSVSELLPNAFVPSDLLQR